MTERIIEPGSVLGVLGSGQLGRMFTIAARRLGYRVHVLSPDDDTPTGQVADVEQRADYLDLERVVQFVQQVQVVTFEFENVPFETTEICERYVPVRPSGHVLYISQNRCREKEFLRRAGLPVTPFQTVQSLNELESALRTLGTPAVLKTADWGYDGKGQRLIRTREEATSAWHALQTSSAVVERFLALEAELSVVGARDQHGRCVFYGPIWNEHRQHILDISVCPGPFDPAIAQQALEMTRTVLEQMNVVGVMCIEFFLTRDGKLHINETAPRPHNSGHLTIDAHVTCQFEQQVRAICGLPLGSPRQVQPAAMANLLGDLWQQGALNWSQMCAHNEVKLHLYGKRAPRPGRKMGHLTALGSTTKEAEQRVRAARQALVTSPSHG